MYTFPLNLYWLCRF